MPAPARQLLLILTTLLLSVPSLQAADQAVPPPADWWKKSSFDPAATYEGFLKKFDFSLAYTGHTGTTGGYALAVDTALTLRRGPWTTYVSYDDIRRKSTQGNAQVSSKYQDARLQEQLDFSRYVFARGGVIWETDTNNNIDQRLLYMAGLGSYLYTSDILHLGAVLGVGQADEEYGTLFERVITLDNQTFSIYYFSQTLDWQLTEWLRFSQSFRIIRSFTAMDDFNTQTDTSPAVVTDRKQRSLIKGKVELQVPIRKYFTMFASYQLNYDSHAWPGYKTTNTVTTLGIHFSY